MYSLRQVHCGQWVHCLYFKRYLAPSGICSTKTESCKYEAGALPPSHHGWIKEPRWMRHFFGKHFRYNHHSSQACESYILTVFLFLNILSTSLFLATPSYSFFFYLNLNFLHISIYLSFILSFSLFSLPLPPSFLFIFFFQFFFTLIFSLFPLFNAINDTDQMHIAIKMSIIS